MGTITKQEYDKLTKQASPKTKSYKTIPTAFCVGGLICVIGQLLIIYYKSIGIEAQQASGLGSITLMLISAILTGLNIYDKIANKAGAGTLVPITGFANAVVSPALEFKSEGLILGLGAKMFTIAGPVIVYGILSSIAYGIIYYLFIF